MHTIHKFIKLKTTVIIIMVFTGVAIACNRTQISSVGLPVSQSGIQSSECHKEFNQSGELINCSGSSPQVQSASYTICSTGHSNGLMACTPPQSHNVNVTFTPRSCALQAGKCIVNEGSPYIQSYPVRQNHASGDPCPSPVPSPTPTE